MVEPFQGHLGRLGAYDQVQSGEVELVGSHGSLFIAARVRAAPEDERGPGAEDDEPPESPESSDHPREHLHDWHSKQDDCGNAEP